MLSQLAYYLILSKPLIFYLGVLTFVLLLSTATIGFLHYKSISYKIPFKWHLRLAATTITVAVIHALLGLSVYLNF